MFTRIKPAIPESELFIDDLLSNGISATALVHSPANGSLFVTFSEEDAPSDMFTFSIQEEQRIASGVLLIPEQRIVRRDANGQPFNVFFSEATIAKALKSLSVKGAFSNVNSEHSNPLSGVHLVELWLTGKVDKASEMGFDVPKGTMMASFYVESDEVWSKIKEGTYLGFSIEGMFGSKKSELSAIPLHEQCAAILNDQSMTEDQQLDAIKVLLSGAEK